jgi:hypothetical protein
MQFHNATQLDGERLEHTFLRHTRPWRHDGLTVRVRYSRGADFSGSCYYRDQRIFINVGRHNRYPYRMGTHIARARGNRTHWWREVYSIVLADAYQLALFVYLHELYHALVHAARRNTRRKEAMCDRFAARVLIEEYGCPIVARDGRCVLREEWDFQDLQGFVGAAAKETGGQKRQTGVAVAATRAIETERPALAEGRSVPAVQAPARPIPVVIHAGAAMPRPAATRGRPSPGQLLLRFEPPQS